MALRHRVGHRCPRREQVEIVHALAVHRTSQRAHRRDAAHRRRDAELDGVPHSGPNRARCCACPHRDQRRDDADGGDERYKLVAPVHSSSFSSSPILLGCLLTESPRKTPGVCAPRTNIRPREPDDNVGDSAHPSKSSPIQCLRRSGQLQVSFVLLTPCQHFRATPGLVKC